MRLLDNIHHNEVYIIAEMSANHAGRLENALEIVRAAKSAGADCIKIQTYTADTMTIDCDNEYFRIHGGLWDGTKLYDLYRRAYTPWEWQLDIKAECEKVGIEFLSTPFDKTAVDFLESIGIEFYKIASFELTDIPLIEYVASKGKPIIISTGMGSYDEISDAVNAVRAKGNNQIVLMKCSSAYPAVPGDMNLKTLKHMRESFHVRVGLSDHSMGSISAVTAVAMGASVIEKHLCLSRDIENPDAAFSMEPSEFKAMVSDIRTAEKAVGSISYECSENEKNSLVFRRSFFAVKRIKKGDAFNRENTRCIRPCYGLKPKYYNHLLQYRSCRDIDFGMPINEDCFLQQDKIDTAIEDASSLKNLLALRPANDFDMQLLFDWANELAVRNNSFSTERILIQEHEKWFKNCLASDKCSIWILSQGNAAIGQVRCELNENAECSINYSIDFRYRGMGYGITMLKMVKEKVRVMYPFIKRITAEVKLENDISKHALIAAGFNPKCMMLTCDL